MDANDNPAEPRTTRKRDRFAYGHLIAWALFGLLFYSSDQFDRSFRLYFLVVPLLALPALSLAVAWLFALGLSIWRKHWRYLCTVMLAPMLLVGIAGSIVSGLLIFRLGSYPDWATSAEIPPAIP